MGQQSAETFHRKRYTNVQQTCKEILSIAVMPERQIHPASRWDTSTSEVYKVNRCLQGGRERGTLVHIHGNVSCFSVTEQSVWRNLWTMVLQPQYKLYIQRDWSPEEILYWVLSHKRCKTTSESTNIWTKICVCCILYGDIHSIYSYWKNIHTLKIWWDAIMEFQCHNMDGTRYINIVSKMSHAERR